MSVVGGVRKFIPFHIIKRKADGLREPAASKRQCQTSFRNLSHTFVSKGEDLASRCRTPVCCIYAHYERPECQVVMPLPDLFPANVRHVRR